MVSYVFEAIITGFKSCQNSEKLKAFGLVVGMELKYQQHLKQDKMEFSE